MWTRAFLIACVAALPVAAQDVPALPPELLDMSDLPEVAAPGWLSDTVTRPHADIASSALPPEVTVMPLGAVTLDAVGLLPGSITGLPASLWGASESETLSHGCSRATGAGRCPRDPVFPKPLTLATAAPPPADALPDQAAAASRQPHRQCLLGRGGRSIRRRR